MNIPSNPSYFPASVAALVLGCFYLTTSYAFYNLNHYKLLVAWGGSALLLFLLWGSDVVAAKRQRQSATTHVSWLLLLVLLLPVLATVPGLVTMGGHYNYFLAQEVALWLICCGWMLLLIRLLQHPQQFAELLLALAVIVIAVAALALWRSLSGIGAAPSLPAAREAGTFGNPNYLASFLVMHIPLFGLCALSSCKSVPSWRGRLYARLLFLAATLLSLMALVFTQSRVAMATLALMLVVLVPLVVLLPGTFPAQVRRAGALLLGSMMVTCVTAVIIFPEAIAALTSSLRSTPESRLVPWRAAWASIEQAPWFGWGPGSSYSLFFQFVDPSSRLLWQERSYAHAHNEVLEILQEGGLLGLMGYLVFVVVLVTTTLRLFVAATLHRDHKLVVIGIACALIAYHLAGMASVDSRMTVVRFSLFTLLALLFCLQRFIGDGAAQQPMVCPYPLQSGPLNANAFYAGIALLLLFSAVLLLPDLASRHRFVGIMQQADDAGREHRLEDLRDENPNVYALEQLVQLEIASGDFAGAATTLHVLDELIPNYSITGYFKAVSYLLRNEEQQARAAALEYQARDLYLPQNAYLLAKIAVMSNGQSLLLQQLDLLLTPLLITSMGWHGVDAASLVVDATQDATVCTATPGSLAGTWRLQLRINSEALAVVMRGVRLVYDGADPTAATTTYRNTITEGVDGLVCKGLTDQQSGAFRNVLRQVLETLARRDLSSP